MEALRSDVDRALVSVAVTVNAVNRWETEVDRWLRDQEKAIVTLLVTTFTVPSNRGPIRWHQTGKPVRGRRPQVLDSGRS